MKWFLLVKISFNGDPNQIFGPFYMLSFFTIQTNFFTGITITIIGFKNNSNKAKNWFFGSIVLITITFLVYWAILSWSTDDYKWSDPYFVISTLFTHGVNPIIGFVILFMIKNEFVLDKKIIGWICLFMSIYIVFHSFFLSSSKRPSAASFAFVCSKARYRAPIPSGWISLTISWLLPSRV